MKIEINSFDDICKYQAILDAEIMKPRDNGFVPKIATELKIRQSAIAECVEFNEELEETHKVWKQKEMSDEKQLSEFVDIFFFLAKWRNKRKIHSVDAYINEGLEYPISSTIEVELMYLQYNITLDCLSDSLICYGRIMQVMGYSKEDIFQEYIRKFKINMDRINKEWSL